MNFDFLILIHSTKSRKTTMISKMKSEIVKDGMDRVIDIDFWHDLEIQIIFTTLPRTFLSDVIVSSEPFIKISIHFIKKSF